MQPPRMLPLLISVLAMPISLLMPILDGPSGMVAIIDEVFAIFSPVQDIMAAEAGAAAAIENNAAVIKILFMEISLSEADGAAGFCRYAPSDDNVSGKQRFLGNFSPALQENFC